MVVVVGSDWKRRASEKVTRRQERRNEGRKRRNLRCLKREKEASDHVYREGKRMDGSVAK